MKTPIKNLFLLFGVIAALDLTPAGRVAAQTFTILHTFDGSDGANPVAELILSGNTLYGTTAGDVYGDRSFSTFFAVNTNGTGFTNLHSFAAGDRNDPQSGFVLSGNRLYATAQYGGSSGNGTVFAMNIDGTGFSNLHSFSASSTNSSFVYTNSDGANPGVGLILSGNRLYGTTQYGGKSGNGTVFAINTDGQGFTNLHSFSASSTNSSFVYTNSDGATALAGLILSGDTLYGTAQEGGSSGNGTVFAINTDGTGFTNLHSFSASSTNSSFVYTNSDGAYAVVGLILSGNTLYGTAQGGGSSGNGTVFAVNTNGTGFRTLHSFTADLDPYYTNSDGAYPNRLILSGNTLYGTAAYGGRGAGTVFALKTDGTSFTNLHNFTYPGFFPFAGLILSCNTLYGTTSDYYGNEFGNYGTVFSLSFPPPQLTITPSGSNLILSWPANVAGFDYTGYILQSTTNLTSSAAWSTNFPAPVIVNGQNTVTNPVSGAQRFYRLSQ